MLIEKKVAIVTGAAQGIGEAICEIFCSEGADVIMADINFNKAKDAAKKISKETGHKCLPLKVDISKKENVEMMVQKTINEFGRIDILVNNAGIAMRKLILDMSEDDWNKVIDVNLKGTFLCSQLAGREMIKQKKGKIISISTCSAKKPTIYEAAYSASKAGILGFNRVLAAEFGPFGINCNCILPGATDTEMIRSTFFTNPEVEKEWIEKTALKRLGRPVDQARVVLFLASYLSDHITGESIVVSAGEMMTQ
ncbi:MAG: SDR family NAD(P)-dependent oxidoreductase [Thiobacillus sp.]